MRIQILWNLHQYYVIYKPFQVLSQFTSAEGKATLKDFFPVPADCYPVGRLDFDSEGLLILTNDADLNHRLLNPRFAHDREYWVQVEGAITPEAIHQLQAGVTISIDGKPYRTRPARAGIFENTTAGTRPESAHPVSCPDPDDMDPAGARGGKEQTGA